MDLVQENETLKPLSAGDRIRWAVERFGSGVALLASMQKTSSVLIHHFSQLAPDNEVLFVDTGFHFHETLRLRDELAHKYRLNTITLYPAQTPEEQEAKFGRKLHLFVDGQPECCRLRKEEPFLQHCRETGKRVVLNGARNAEGGKRRVAPLTADPRFGGYVLHPLLEWSDEDVASYLEANEVPIHPLHAKSYPSVGCACCTTPVGPGESERAGRWRHLRPTDGSGPQFCGINFSDGAGI